VADVEQVIPLTGRRVGARLLVALVAICALGGLAGLVVEGRDTSWMALWSLLVPGLGQLVQGATVTGIVMLALWLFLLADLLVLFNGVVRLGFVPVIALCGASALDAATHGAWWSIPVGAVAALGVAVVVEQVNYRAKQRRLARVAEARGPRAAERPAAPSPAVPAADRAEPAMDRFTESYLRYFLRFGHAAPTDWSVFDDPNHVDAALRYQLVLAAWALFLTQHRHTPAFREASAQALGNFAERLRDHRAWSYTRGQHLTSFRWDGDPFRHENVMYAGYAADVVSMYEAMSGDMRYDLPGGFSVADGRRTYEWSHTEIIDNLALQHAASPHGAISCVPGWLWPACQTFSLRAITLGDLVHGEDHDFAASRYSKAFGRFFVSRDARIDTCRHLTGVAHPTDRFIIGLTGQAGHGAFMAPFGRHHVEEHYERQVRSRMLPRDDGRVELRISKLDTLDTSAGWNPAQPYSVVLLYATEMGDTEMAAGLRRTLETMLTPEDDRPGPGSIVSMALTLMALADTEGGLGAAHTHVPAHDTTPELESAPYPEVVVTGARTDGQGLRVAVAPGPAANGTVELTVARLRPGATYRVAGGADPAQDAVAGADGRVRVKVSSSVRQEISLSRTG
jgi:hypothetical protein